MDPHVAKKVADFFKKYPVRSYKKGQILVHAGDAPECIMSIVTGSVKQYDLTYRGDEVVLNVFKEPAFFPMSYAINRTPNDYFFEAYTDVKLRKVPFEDAIEFIKKNPDVLYDLLGRVYRGTDGLMRRMAHLMASSARSRVVYELIIESRRFGEQNKGSYLLNINESEIGSRAGLSRETVNREVSKLKSLGLIKIGKQIVVPNLEDLEVLLGREL